jgi:PKD repeat protein
MDIKIFNNNSITKRETSAGAQYIVNLGTVIYNNKLVRIDNLVIPIFDQKFFTLPEDSGKYAVVNVYYQLKPVEFIFDRVSLYDKFVSRASAGSRLNAVPICQFVLKQESKGFVVDHINEFSQMSTFSISDNLVQGDTGARGPLGDTGIVGYTGVQGFTGYDGYQGITGAPGITGYGPQGDPGQQGATGPYPDLSLQLYIKFKENDTKVTDYSIYERDLEWGISGGGSYFVHQEGVVDSAHKVKYAGGYSAYKRNIFLPFGESGAIYYPFGIGSGITGVHGYTGGTISAWVKVDQGAIPSFTFEVIDPVNNLIKFTDTSLFFPTKWLWEFGDGSSSVSQNPTHQYSSAGEYIVKLTATNAAGSNYVYVLVSTSAEDAWDTVLEF